VPIGKFAIRPRVKHPGHHAEWSGGGQQAADDRDSQEARCIDGLARDRPRERDLDDATVHLAGQRARSKSDHRRAGEDDVERVGKSQREIAGQTGQRQELRPGARKCLEGGRDALHDRVESLGSAERGDHQGLHELEEGDPDEEGHEPR
jgi:hypothetical protein